MSPLRRDVIIVCIAAAAVVAFSARQVYHELLLSRHAQEIQATVVSKNLGHAWIEYSYVVAGRTYEGSTPSTSTGKTFDSVSIGDTLTVQFDPTNPGVSGTTETREAIGSTVPFLLAVLGTLAAVMFLRNVLRKREAGA